MIMNGFIILSLCLTILLEAVHSHIIPNGVCGSTMLDLNEPHNIGEGIISHVDQSSRSFPEASSQPDQFMSTTSMTPDGNTLTASRSAIMNNTAKAPILLEHHPILRLPKKLTRRTTMGLGTDCPDDPQRGPVFTSSDSEYCIYLGDAVAPNGMRWQAVFAWMCGSLGAIVFISALVYILRKRRMSPGMGDTMMMTEAEKAMEEAAAPIPQVAHPLGTCVRVDGPPPWWWPGGMAWPPSATPPA